MALTSVTQEGTRTFDEQEDQTIYRVVVNHEEQYSLWPANKAVAVGWHDAGKSGTKDECPTTRKSGPTCVG